MKDDAHLVDVLDLKNSFENFRCVRKADLRRFYRQRHPNLTEQTFRRILYALEK